MALVDQFAGVIFDYGGVLVKHQSDGDQGRLAEIAGLTPQLFSELYWSDRAEYDKGLVSGVEYWQNLALRGQKVFTEATVNELIEFDTIAWMQFDPAMFEWVEELRGIGKKVAVLSNMPRELGEALKTRTQRFQQFDHVTLSYEINSAKPEPAIYEHCLTGLGLAAKEVVFLDDRLENIHGGEHLGIHGVQFTSRDDVLPKLRN